MPFKFGVDSSGNYGYIKDGADTVTPFRTGNATTAQVLAGYTFANATYPNLTGAMTNNGGTSTSATYSLDSTNSRVVVTIPSNGYYNTSSKLYNTYANVRTLIGLTAAKIVSGNTILGIAGTASSVSTVKLVTKTFGAGEPSLNYTTTEAYTVLIAVEHGHTYGGGSLSITGSGVNSQNIINNQMQPETTRVNYCLNAPKGTKVSAYCNGPGGAFIIGIK